MDGLQRLLDFANHLRSQRMPFLIGQDRCDALTLSFGTFGNRFAVDFSEDRVSCRRFRGDEGLRANLRNLHAMIEAEPAAPVSAPAIEGHFGSCAAEPASGMRRLLDFTARLRADGISHAIEQQSPDALEVSLTAQGRRLEVEFSPDRVLYSVFDAQPADAFDEEAIRSEIDVFTRPYHPPMRLRRESNQAAE